MAAAGTVDARINRAIYDTAGRQIYAIAANGMVTAFTYDAAGNPIKSIAYATLYTVAAAIPTATVLQSWLSTRSTAADRTTRTLYDAAGRGVYSVDPEGYVTETRYDKAGRVTRSIRYIDAQTVVDATTSTT